MFVHIVLVQKFIPTIHEITHQIAYQILIAQTDEQAG